MENIFKNRQLSRIIPVEKAPPTNIRHIHLILTSGNPYPKNLQCYLGFTLQVSTQRCYIKLHSLNNDYIALEQGVYYLSNAVHKIWLLNGTGAGNSVIDLWENVDLRGCFDYADSLNLANLYANVLAGNTILANIYTNTNDIETLVTTIRNTCGDISSTLVMFDMTLDTIKNNTTLLYNKLTDAVNFISNLHSAIYGGSGGERNALLLTDTPLGIGASYTGILQDVELSRLGFYHITGFSDQASAVNGVIIEQSWDNVNWDYASTFSSLANTGLACKVAITGRYIRVRWINGAVAQTTFRLGQRFSIS